jgi:hypothetical protein
VLIFVEKLGCGAAHGLAIVRDVGDFDQLPGELHAQVVGGGGGRLEEILGALDAHLALLHGARRLVQVLVVGVRVLLAGHDDEPFRERLAQLRFTDTRVHERIREGLRALVLAPLGHRVPARVRRDHHGSAIVREEERHALDELGARRVAEDAIGLLAVAHLVEEMLDERERPLLAVRLLGHVAQVVRRGFRPRDHLRRDDDEAPAVGGEFPVRAVVGGVALHAVHHEDDRARAVALARAIRVDLHRTVGAALRVREHEAPLVRRNGRGGEGAGAGKRGQPGDGPIHS